MPPIATAVASSVVSICTLGTRVKPEKMNRSRCRLGGRLDHVSSEMHTGATWRIRLNNSCAAAMRPLMPSYFDYLFNVSAFSNYCRNRQSLTVVLLRCVASRPVIG